MTRTATWMLLMLSLVACDATYLYDPGSSSQADPNLENRTGQAQFDLVNAGDAGSGPSVSVPPSFNADGVAVTLLSLNKVSAAVGESLQLTYVVQTNRPVTFVDLNGSVRDSQHLNDAHLDFAHHTQVTVNGSQTFTDVRSEDHADSYRVAVAYTLDGSHWVGLPLSLSFSVGLAPPAPTPVPDAGSPVGADAGVSREFNSDGVAVTVMALSRSSVNVGESLQLTYTVKTNRPVTFANLNGSVRDSQNINNGHLDFAHHQQVTVNGSQTFNDVCSEDHADTYNVTVAYTLDGSHWVRIPITLTFKVTAVSSAFNADGVLVAALPLSASSVKIGENLQVSYTVQTNRPVTFAQITASVRESQTIDDGHLDFPHHNQVTVNGSQTFTDVRSEDHADTYTVYVAYTLDGNRWVRLPLSVKFSVVAPPPTGTGTPDAGTVGDGGPAGWRLTWADEFNAPDGTAVDRSKWGFEVGGGGWGNQEREFYTDSTDNAVQRGGSLIITARQEGADQFQCWYGACRSTSARMITKYKFAQQYGRIEARIQVPAGRGMWPGWWMLGDNFDAVGWPNCGEIDIMENIGSEPNTAHGSLHGPGYGPGPGITGQYNAPFALSSGFHVYAVEWEEGVIRWYLDSTLYETRTTAEVPAGGTWVFNRPFYLLMNLAVGGTWPGDPDNNTHFPAELRVDYVRVYAR